MKLTYWVATINGDANCYSIRGKTRKAVVAAVAADGGNRYDAPKKVTVDYDNAFDLMTLCLSEGGGYWEF